MNKNFKVKRSKEKGFGLFAERDFSRGDRLIEYKGEIIEEDEANRRLGMYLFALPKKLTIDGSPRYNMARYINHSCNPNAVAYLSDNKKRVFIFARRKIVMGEEIFYDYGKEFFEEFILPYGCKCGFCDGKGNKIKKKR